MKMKSKKWRYLLWAVVGLVTLIALAHAIENYRGAKAWAKAKQAYEEEGGSLDWETVWPKKTIPDEENFAAIPLLQGLTPIGQAADGKRESIVDVFKKVPGGPSMAMVSKNSRRTVQPFDASSWRDYLTSHAWPVPVDEPDDARAVLAAVEAQWEGFTQFDEVAMRPSSQLLPPVREHWDLNRPELAASPHLNTVRVLTRLVRLRAQAAIHCAERDIAKRSLASGFRLAQAMDHEPTLISHLVKTTQVALLMSPIWESLHSHLWEEADLQWLEMELAGIDMRQTLSLSLKTEICFMLSIADRLSRGSSDDRKQLFSAFRAIDNKGSLPALLMSTLVPKGWWDQNRAQVVIQLQHLINGLQHEVIDPTLADERSPEGPLPYHFMSRMMAPMAGNAIKGCTLMQVMITQARIACMLERYYLQHQRYPEALDALGDTIPADLMGEPWRYACEPDGATYTLYSVGWNLTDEGGLVTEKERWQGDWVWGKR